MGAMSADTSTVKLPGFGDALAHRHGSNEASAAANPAPIKFLRFIRLPCYNAAMTAAASIKPWKVSGPDYFAECVQERPSCFEDEGYRPQRWEVRGWFRTSNPPMPSAG